MKHTAISSLILLSVSNVAFSQSGDMMSARGYTDQTKNARQTIHKAVGVVKAVDVAQGKVTLAHEPIKTLNWPAMTMRFSVKDKTLFDRLTVGKKVNVDIMEQGSDYVVTAIN